MRIGKKNLTHLSNIVKEQEDKEIIDILRMLRGIEKKFRKKINIKPPKVTE